MSKKIHLEKGEIALYIGSGTDEDNINQIKDWTDADTIILSDLRYNNKNTQQKEGATIITTNDDGYDILQNKDNIGFVMIDQAATERFNSTYEKIKIGTYLYLNTFRSSMWSHPLYQKRMGLNNIKEDLYKKTKNVTDKDIQIADNITQIDNNIEFLIKMPNIKTNKKQKLNSVNLDLDNDNKPYFINDYGEIISKESLSKSITKIKKGLTHIKTQIDKSEKTYLNNRLLTAQQHISSLDEKFYKETKKGLDNLLNKIKF